MQKKKKKSVQILLGKKVCRKILPGTGNFKFQNNIKRGTTVSFLFGIGSKYGQLRTP
jgi:hypothetical protein